MDAKAFDSVIFFLSSPYMDDKKRIAVNKPGVLYESDGNYVVKADLTYLIRRDIVLMVVLKSKK